MLSLSTLAWPKALYSLAFKGTIEPYRPFLVFFLPAYVPTGTLSGVTYGVGFSLICTYDNRMRITCETGPGTIMQGVAPGFAKMTVTELEQSQ